MTIDKYQGWGVSRQSTFITEAISDDKTNDFVAWKAGRVPIKARSFEYEFLIYI